LDGIAGERVGVVDADLRSAGTGSVVVEEPSRDVDAADPVEVDGERVVGRVVAVVVDGDRAERPVADVGARVAGDV
jgi:hypothetical protein